MCVSYTDRKKDNKTQQTQGMKASHMTTTAGLDHQHTHYLKHTQEMVGEGIKNQTVDKKDTVTIMPPEI